MICLHCHLSRDLVGLPLKSLPYLLYSQAVMNELEGMEGVKVGETNLNNVRYVDDSVQIADTNAKLQRVADKFNVEYNRIRLNINISRTEVMGITRSKG